MTRQERRTLFKEVAVQLIRTRPMGVVKGTAGGDIVCPDFLRDVALVTENLIAAADKFEHLDEGTIKANRAVRDEYDARQVVYKSIDPVTVTNWRTAFKKAVESVVVDNSELLQQLADVESTSAKAKEE